MSRVPAPAEFVRVLTPAVREAAAIALSLEGRVANRPKTGEVSDVKAALTQADTACQESILKPLHAAFPDVALEAEEDTPSVSLFPGTAPARVVIDPIDGTLNSYLEGLGPYAVIVGLAVAGRYEAALLALPREGLLLSGTRERVTIAAGDAGELSAATRADGQRVWVSHATPQPVIESLRSEGLDPRPACGGAAAAAPLLPGACAGIRTVSGGQGVSLRSRVGAMLARVGGAVILDEAGRPVPESLDAPVQALISAADDRLARVCLAALERAR